MKNSLTKYRTLVSNFSYLSILELLSLLFPLITYPYLIHILGKELYGVVIYAQSVAAYLTIIVNFGFNISATKDISINRDNIYSLSRIVNSIILLKLVLFLIIALPYVCIILLTNITYHKALYIFSLGLCIQEVFFPTWFFQGVEKMKYITLISFISRLCFLLLIFILVKSSSDYLYIPLFYTMGGIVSTLISFYILKNKFKLLFFHERINYLELKQLFKDSLPFFFSRFINVVTEKTNTILIGPLLGYEAVSTYDLGVKIINILRIPLSLVSQVLYPSVAKSRNLNLLKISLKGVAVFSIVLIILIYFSAPYIVNFLGNGQLPEATKIVYMLSCILPFVGCSYILGASTLVVFGYTKEYNVSVLLGFISYISIVLVSLFLYEITIQIMVTTFIIPEIVICIYRFNKARQYNLL